MLFLADLFTWQLDILNFIELIIVTIAFLVYCTWRDRRKRKVTFVPELALAYCCESARRRNTYARILWVLAEFRIIRFHSFQYSTVGSFLSGAVSKACIGILKDINWCILKFLVCKYLFGLILSGAVLWWWLLSVSSSD